MLLPLLFVLPLAVAPHAEAPAAPEGEARGPRVGAIDESLDEVGWSVVASVESVARELAGHARRTASDPRLEGMLADGDVEGLSDFTTRIVASSQLVDALALLGPDGEVMAYEDRGRASSIFGGARLRSLMATSFHASVALRLALAEEGGADSLEFRTDSIGGPHLDGAEGLYVAFTTPVKGSDGRVKGALCAQVSFQRVLSRVRTGAFQRGGGRVWFVTPDGTLFDERVRKGGDAPAEPEQLARLMGAIDWTETPSFRYSRGSETLSLYSIPGLRTLEGAELMVLLSAPRSWLEALLAEGMEENRALRSRTNASFAVAGLLALVVLLGWQARRRLVAAYERADRASHSKSAFLANTSHEIRTPMTAILGYAELLGGEGGDAPTPELQSEAVAAIQQHGRHLLTLIGDVLDLSKIEAGAIEIERLPCDPAAIAQEAATLLRERAEDKGLVLQVRVASDVPRRVSLDPTRVRQVLLNLVGNAIKFTEEGSVTIHVESFRAAGAQRMAYVVEDTGIGMTPSAAATIFEAYVQAERSTTRRFGGTGLGLAISKQLTELMGGSIECSSLPGRGTKFRFTVLAPGVDDVAAPEPAAPLPAARRAPAAPADRPPRVLLVDDGPTNRRLFSLILTKEGVDVSLACDGLEALSAWEEAEAPFDLILMDAQMPGMDGVEALRALRQRGATTPVVVLTADAVSGARERYLAEGFDGFLSKPISREALVEAVAEWTATRG